MIERTHNLILALFTTTALCGCGYIRQTFSTNLDRLVPYGVRTIPDEDGILFFQWKYMGDDELAGAFRYIQAYEPTHINFGGREISDLSVSLLLQLDSVEELDLYGTRITKEGFKRLGKMRKLRRLWVTTLNNADLAELREALKGKVTVVSQPGPGDPSMATRCPRPSRCPECGRIPERKAAR